MDCLPSNLERVVQENMLVVFVGDLNCNLLKPDSQVTKLESITSQYGLTQMIIMSVRQSKEHHHQAGELTEGRVSPHRGAETERLPQ